MPCDWSRRAVLTTGSVVLVSLLGGCSTVTDWGSSGTPLAVRVANPGNRPYRISIALFRKPGDDLDDARVMDESYEVEPTDGFETITEVTNRRYHVRAAFDGLGLASQAFDFEYYPSCGSSDDLDPELFIIMHPRSDRAARFIEFEQSECQVSA